MSQTPEHAASAPDQPAPPSTVPEAESRSSLDIYAAYSPPYAAPPVGVTPHNLKEEKQQGEKISVPIVVGAISIIVLLLLIYSIFNAVSNDSYLALAS